MGRLFEGVTFDFQAAKKEAAEKAAKEATEKAAKEAEQEIKITRHIAKMLMNQYSEPEIIKSLMKDFNLSEEQSEEELRKMMEFLEEE